MSSFALPKSLTSAYWTGQTSGSDKSKDAAKTAVTTALKAVETQSKLVDPSLVDVSKLTAAADIAKRSDELDAAKAALDKLETQIKAAKDAAQKFLKALGSPDKKITQTAAEIDKEGKSFIDKATAELAAASKALAEKQKAAAAAAAKAPGAAAPDKKALALATSYRKLGMTAMVNAQKKVPPKAARFMVIEFKQQVLLYMGLKYDRKLTEGAMKALNQSKHPDDPYVKTWFDAASKVIWEKDTLTLVSDKIPNKLATRISKSSKLVLGKSVKVRMRNSKGEVAESENKDVDKIDAAALAKELAAMAPDPDADNDVDAVSDDSHEDDDDKNAKKSVAAAPIDNKAAVAVKGAWSTVRKSASAEVDGLIVQIRGIFPKGQHVAELDEAEKTLKKFMTAFAALDDQLDLVAQQKDKAAREKTIRDVLAKVADLRKLQKHPVMQNLDDNEVKKIKAGEHLFAGLDTIDAVLKKELATA